MKNFIVVNDTHFMSKSGTRLDILPALLEKWEWVLGLCKANGAVLLHTGDFFNSSVVPDEVKNAIMLRVKFHDVRIFGIPGNHDMMYSNDAFYDKTSLRNLELAGCISMVTSELDFGGVSVAPVGVKTSQPAIVLGHGFLDQGSEWVIKVSDLDIYDKPTCVFLGHDHKAYPPSVVNIQTPTICYRHGSFIRQSVDCVDATPSVACVSFNGKDFDVQVVPIAVAKQAVFISNSSHSINLDAMEVGELVASLSTITTESKDLNFYLKTLSSPEVLSYIQNLK